MAGKHRLPSAPDNVRKTTIYLDECLKDRVRYLAEREGYSVSTWTARLIEHEIELIERARELGKRYRSVTQDHIESQ